MKRTVAIFLLVVFLFNVGGYYIVFWGLRHHAERVLTDRLDAGIYSGEETIELKIPVTLPYPIQQRDFERVDGKFEHDGQHYKLVKHKLENDTMYVVCIRDVQEKKLLTTMKDYVKLANDLPANTKKSNNFFSKLLKDFESADTNNLVHQKGWEREISLTSRSFSTLSQVRNISSPPPKV